MDNLEANIMDKSMRSVFGKWQQFCLEDLPICIILVGNIPYEATEEKLKDIFGEVGQVLSFKYKNKIVVNQYYKNYVSGLSLIEKLVNQKDMDSVNTETKKPPWVRWEIWMAMK